MSAVDDEPVPKRRRRTKVNFLDSEEVGNEEKRMIQQALENSRVETKRENLALPQAPVYYPTVEEFKNPLGYIDSIRKEAEKWGICKIVPPEGWSPPNMIDFRDPRKFPTKKQILNTLQEGQGFDSGKRYSIAEYKTMADTFYQLWNKKHYNNALDAKDVVKDEKESESLYTEHNGLDEETNARYDKLRKDYWDMVEMGTGSVSKHATVEYANDLDTTKYCSGFPLKGSSVNTSGAGNWFKEYSDEDDRPPTAEAVVAANAAAVAAASAKQEKVGDPSGDTGLGMGEGLLAAEQKAIGVESKECEDMFSDDYYKRTGWNLVNIASSEGSVLSHLKTSINGVNVPWLYIGMLFSSFCWHNEDNYLYSINYSHFGEAKQWYGVPGAHAKRFEQVTKNFLLESFKDTPDLLHHMTTQISPSLLARHGIPVCQTIQSAKSFVVTFPKAFHAGFSYGFNCGEAVNFATPDWLHDGTEADERYRVFARSSVFSHQRLLFTLLYHNGQEFGKERKGQFREKASYTTLLLEIKKCLDEELLARPWLISQGVRDISNKVKLPSNNFRCIDEISSNYDDLRSCCHCKHICLLTALACECDRNKVSCVRHLAATCKCPIDKRYMLQWMSTDDMQNMSTKISRMLETEDLKKPKSLNTK